MNLSRATGQGKARCDMQEDGRADGPEFIGLAPRVGLGQLDLPSVMAYNDHSILIIVMGIYSTTRFGLATGKSPVGVACRVDVSIPTCSTWICCCLFNCMCMACCHMYAYLETGPRE